jgi:DivIVA domain-containing protein
MIERRDFPTGRRGYDPAAVDEHLRRVADEFETRVHAPAATLSSGASEQVRGILEAAERGAAAVLANASEDASGHVARVQQAADGMLAQIDQLERELGGLLDALRTAGERLTTGLAALQAEVAGAAADTVEPAGADEDHATPMPAPDAVPDEAGARLIALNMALGGSSREDTARYLAENFALADPDALLEDVYERAGR